MYVCSHQPHRHTSAPIGTPYSTHTQHPTNPHQAVLSKDQLRSELLSAVPSRPQPQSVLPTDAALAAEAEQVAANNVSMWNFNLTCLKNELPDQGSPRGSDSMQDAESPSSAFTANEARPGPGGIRRNKSTLSETSMASSSDILSAQLSQVPHLLMFSGLRSCVSVYSHTSLFRFHNPSPVSFITRVFCHPCILSPVCFITVCFITVCFITVCSTVYSCFLTTACSTHHRMKPTTVTPQNGGAETGSEPSAPDWSLPDGMAPLPPTPSMPHTKSSSSLRPARSLGRSYSDMRLTPSVDRRRGGLANPGGDQARVAALQQAAQRRGRFVVCVVACCVQRETIPVTTIPVTGGYGTRSLCLSKSFVTEPRCFVGFKAV